MMIHCPNCDSIELRETTKAVPRYVGTLDAWGQRRLRWVKSEVKTFYCDDCKHTFEEK